jgi:DNA-binding MarR family transcriptional regulator
MTEKDMTEKTITEARVTLGSLLRRPYERLQAKVYAGLAVRGFPDIRPAHSSFFRYVSPLGSRVSVLAEQAQITKQSMAYLTEDLEKRGYVEILPDPSDGRAKLVRLTDKGFAVWETLVELSQGLEAECARLIGTQKIAELRAILAELAQALEG